ncbi:MAG TPA: amidophosphoribosyltransferase [Clostridiales bacterium]|nr:amidophosphoribosyltransferase [Clostridiales bacterium]
MGGIFGVVSKNNCIKDLFFGTDYHSHLGTSRGGMTVWTGKGFARSIHNIENTQFRTKFEDDLGFLSGNLGIGCISDTEPQPLTVRSHLGDYALTTVGRINNILEIARRLIEDNHIHLMEMRDGEINATELVMNLINEGQDFKEGILNAQNSIDGSCSLLVLTSEGIYASRDLYGRTPLFLGKKDDGYALSFESSAFSNLGYDTEYELGPGEIIFVEPDGYRQVSPPKDKMKICAFLWVYFGYPSSTYQGVNVEAMRYRNGAIMAGNDDVTADMVAGIPDSGIAHAIGYANESHFPYARPFVKYTPTWPRSFTPQDQSIRNLVAKMKLLPVHDLVSGKRIIFCDDSIVRGTQLGETVDLLYKCDVKEMHMRSACPPLLFGCKYLNFSRAKSEMDLIARRMINELEDGKPVDIHEYADNKSKKHCQMINKICKKMNFTTLKYQTIEGMVDAIGLPPENVCTYCWDGKE